MNKNNKMNFNSKKFKNNKNNSFRNNARKYNENGDVLKKYIESINFNIHINIEKIEILVCDFITLKKETEISELRNQITELENTQIFCPIDIIYREKNIKKILMQIEVKKNVIEEFKLETENIVSSIITLQKEINQFDMTHTDSFIILEGNLDIMNYKFFICLDEYVSIIEKYTNLNFNRVLTRKEVCESCGHDTDYTIILDEEEVCSSCNCVINSFKTYESNQDGNDERSNFLSTLKQFQSLQGLSVLPNGLEMKLDLYFKSMSFPIGSEVRTWDYTEDGKKENTSIYIMQKALKNINSSKHYENIRLICNWYWGWKSINISEKYNKIIKDYDKVLSIYESINTERSSKINNQYMLWWLLNQNGIYISCKDLKFIKTRETIDYYEKIRNKISQKLGWEWFPLK